MRALIFATMIFGVSFIASGTATAQSCRAVAQPRIQVDFQDKPVTYRHDKSIRTINQLRGKPADVLVQGLTALKWEVSFDADWEGVPVATGYCLRPINPTVTLKVRAHNVWLPREFPAGSCEFNAVRVHENKHVTVNRQILAQLREALRNRLQAELRKLSTQRPFPGSAFDSRARRAMSGLGRVMSRTENRLSRAMDRAQARVDTRVEYERVNRSCGPGSLLQRDFRTR